jgi:hypothetical protein
MASTPIILAEKSTKLMTFFFRDENLFVPAIISDIVEI